MEMINNLEDICDVITKGTTPTSVGFNFVLNGTVNFIKIESIDKDGNILTDKIAKISEECNEFLKRSQLKEGDILFSIAGALGRVGIVTKNILPSNTNQALAIIRLKDKSNINIRYIKHILSSEYVQNQVSNSKGGVAQQNLSLAQIKKFQIPEYSLDKKLAIVEKLDKAFELIDQAKANIEQNIINAKELFQSKLDEVMNVKIDGWKSDNLVDITSILGDGLHGTPKYSDDGDYYFVNGNNLSDKGIVIKENTKRVSEDEFYKYRKELNDRTIFVSINGTLGNVSFYNNEKIILGKSACYFNVLDGFDKEFLMYHFKAPRFIKYAHKEATGATIKNVSLKSMRNFVVHYPDLQKQKIIVKYLNNVKIYTDNLLNDYQEKLSNLEELRKSILEKAFKGELTN